MITFFASITYGTLAFISSLDDGDHFEQVHSSYVEYQLLPIEFKAKEQVIESVETTIPPEPVPTAAPPEVRTDDTLSLNATMATPDQVEDWKLRLVNANNPLPTDFLPPLSSLANGLQFDSRAIGQLNAMLEAMRAQGLSPVVNSAYRSIAQQTTLFNNRVTQLTGTGLSREQAEQQAATSIARPGTSEHNLGLAVDIVDLSYQHLTNNQANTPVGQWLAKNSADFGFILRYPQGTQHITGVIFEPWHFRYVGVVSAQNITSRGITLEEYLSK